ncbi:MAG: hypothetical protein M3270_10950 [Thermoproteota archaeon]|nr:hypothetical protein [Thermoproteota archaeon]
MDIQVSLLKSGLEEKKQLFHQQGVQVRQKAYNSTNNAKDFNYRYISRNGFVCGKLYEQIGLAGIY